MNFLFSRSSWVTAAALAALFGVFCFHESAGIAFPYVNLDEQGHVSYALHLAQSLEFFPSLTQMRLYDFEQLRWSAEPNFINHPSLGYHTLGLFTDFGSVGPHVRTASIAFFALGFAAILFGLHAAGIFTNLGLVAAAMFCVLLKVQRFGETFSNDSVAFFGGGLVFLGTALLWTGKALSARRNSALPWAGLALRSVLRPSSIRRCWPGRLSWPVWRCSPWAGGRSSGGTPGFFWRCCLSYALLRRFPIFSWPRNLARQRQTRRDRSKCSPMAGRG